MTQQELMEAGRLIDRWINIRLKFEKRLRYDPETKTSKSSLITREEIINNFRADVDHSSLLSRLAMGKEPLPFAPPKMFSCPAYYLFDDEKPEDKIIHEVVFDWPNCVALNQATWKIIEKINDEEYIVQWQDLEPMKLFKNHVWMATSFKKNRIGEDIYGMAWVLGRLPENVQLP